MDEITRRNFLDFQALAILNSILSNNLLIHGQSNIEALWAYLQTLIGTSDPASIFTDYQRIIIFQISDDQNLALQITELDSFYTRLCGNNCSVSFVLRVITLLSAILHLQNFISIFILSSYISISNLTQNVVCFAIQAEFSRQTNITNTSCHSSILYRNKPSQ